MVGRRAVLTTGTASVVLLGLGGTWWGTTRPARTAREPWRAAGAGLGDPRLDVLAYSILAPNPHNMQPWQIRLGHELDFTVYCDPERLLPETDPPNRQITIGFGCFLELCRQAAAESGFRAEITYFPDGEPQPLLDDRPIAAVRLVRDAAVDTDPLFAGILERRTSRLEFDTGKPVDPGVLSALRDASVDGVKAFTSADAGTVGELRELAADAWLTEWSTPAVRRESIEVTRIGRAEVDAEPYGLAIDDRVSSTLGLTGTLSREAMDDADSIAYRESHAFYARACQTSMAFVWTTTATNTRSAQLEAGRAWVRIQLAANALGVSFHPLSQALQEFPEMSEHYDRAHQLLAAEPGETVQMLSRLGYGAAVPPAPREPLESRLRPG